MNRNSTDIDDNAGNLKSVSGNTANYNAENQITSVSGTGIGETILYDGLGQRVQKAIAGGSTTVYVYDAFGLASEYTNGSWSKDYIQEGGGTLIATENASGPCRTCYLSYDLLGSVRAVVDGSGNVVGRHAFLPFGEEIQANTAGRDAHFGSTTDVSQKFTGQIRDQESGMDFFNARYFTAALDRFNSPDPGNAGADLSNPQTLNGYAYVGDNPLAMVDPTGMCADPNATSHDPQCQDGPWEQTNGASAYLGGFADPFQVSQIPVTIMSYVQGQAPQPISLQFPNNATSATITFGTPPGSWQTVQVGTAGDYLDPSTYDVPVGIDIWKGQQQLWHNTAVIGNAAAVVTGAIVAAPVVADAASSWTLARLAVGPGRPWGIHFAVGVGGTWLHWLPDAMDEFGNFSAQITTEAAEAWAARMAWFRIPVPILSPAGVLGTIGKPASNCLTGACYAIGQGWIP